jgi:two-component system response regulator HupR/HoxA
MAAERPLVLVVDDEVRSLETLERTLEEQFEVRTASTTAEAERILQAEWVQIVLCDQRMPEGTGVEFLSRVREQWPEAIRMIISGFTNSEEIINAINHAGIYHYITKPWHPEQLLLTLTGAIRLFELQRDNEALSVELKSSPTRLQRNLNRQKRKLRQQFSCEDGMVRAGGSPLEQVCERIRRVAPYDISVLISGESGTGKELAARALHYNSQRWERPFVVENCAALPDELLESELFGYKRGAFTGAIEDRDGMFQRADGGTIFLDEIGDISPAFQAKLLRVLQEGEVRPLGSGQTRRVDVRVIAATNRDLEAEMRAGRFREDLFYRLAAVTIHIPPLRERPGDIRLIAESLLAAARGLFGREVEGFSGEAIECMKRYHWPGNVREPLLGADLLSPRVLYSLPDGSAPVGDNPLTALLGLSGSLKERVEQLEVLVLRETLIRNRWNKSQAARELKLSRVGLRSKLERYGLIQEGGDE